MGYRLDTENYKNFKQYVSNIISELCKIEFRNKKIINAKSIFELINDEIITNLQQIQNLQLYTRAGKGWWIDSKDNFVIEGVDFRELKFSSSLTKNIVKVLHNKIIDVKDLDALFNDNKYRYTIHDDVDRFDITFEIDGEVILKTSIPGKIYWDVGSEEKNVILRSWVVRIELPEIIRLSDKFFSIHLEKKQDKKIFVPDDDDDEYEYDEYEYDNVKAGDDDCDNEELKRKKERLMLGFIDDKDVELSNKEQMKKDRIEESDEQELDENDINELVDKPKSEAGERLSKTTEHMHQESEKEILIDEENIVCSHNLKDENHKRYSFYINIPCINTSKEIEKITMNIKFK